MNKRKKKRIVIDLDVATVYLWKGSQAADAIEFIKELNLCLNKSFSPTKNLLPKLLQIGKKPDSNAPFQIICQSHGVCFFRQSKPSQFNLFSLHKNKAYFLPYKSFLKFAAGITNCLDRK